LYVKTYLFPKIRTIYGNGGDREIYSNLFTFISATAASNKGIIVKSKDTLQKKLKYEKETHIKKLQDNEALDNKQKIIFKPSLIPANNSYASFNENLYLNDGVGMIFQTEADEMNKAKKQDWGDYSSAIRNAGHHEEISWSRKGEDTIIIEKPKLSICMSGTLKQLLNFVGDENGENGFFSRFLFYCYTSKFEYKNQFEKKTNIVNIQKLSDQLFEIENYMNRHPYTFELTKKQIDKFTKINSKRFKDAEMYLDDEFKQYTTRIAVQQTRIMMILSILRTYDKLKNTELADTDLLICEDIDFDIAASIIDVLYEHAEFVFQNIKGSSTLKLKGSSRSSELYDLLPIQFLRNRAIDIGKSIDISIRTVDTILKGMITNGKLKKETKFLRS